MAKRSKVFDPDWYENQIERYRAIHPDYVLLAEALQKALEKLQNIISSPILIQTRSKTLASFAEKIQRAGRHYVDPLEELPDLCGARIITHTLGEVSTVCHFLEKHFHIFEEDTHNKLDLMKSNEFGYLSYHYLVAFKPDTFSADTVPATLVEKNLKAEIQVRTILQHAWADIAHEWSYKSRFDLPRRWKREFDRLAALLEEADQGFERLQRELKEYASSYDAYYSKEQLQTEIEKARIILQADPDNSEIAHHMAKMAMWVGDWDLAINTLSRFRQRGIPSLLRDLGISLCKRHNREVESPCYQEGQDCLHEATEQDPGDVDAWAALGGSWRTLEHATLDPKKKGLYRNKARSYYRKAFEIDPSDPYALGNFIEYEVAAHPDLDLIAYFRPSLKGAIERCDLHQAVGINLPWAFFDLGKFHLLLNEPYKALAYYAKGAESSVSPVFLDSALRSFGTLNTFDSALQSFETMQAARTRLPGFDWSQHFIEIARTALFPEQPQPLLAPSGITYRDGPVVIVAGYCDTATLAKHHTLLSAAFNGFCGVVISGGTRSGIASLVGELQTLYPDALETLGYVPNALPAGVERDERYSQFIESSGNDFSPLEALQYWRDLLESKRIDEQVRLLAVGGGKITGTEIAMALALGVPVGVITSAGGEPARLRNDPLWSSLPHFRALPEDPETLRHFLQHG